MKSFKIESSQKRVRHDNLGKEKKDNKSINLAVVVIHWGGDLCILPLSETQYRDKINCNRNKKESEPGYAPSIRYGHQVSNAS